MVDLINTPTNDLARTFAPQNLNSNDYSLARSQNLRGTRAFVVEFKTKPGQTARSRGGNLTRGGDPRHKMKGKRWIDSNTMQVMRLELEEEDPPMFQETMKTEADYGPVSIAGKSFWLLTRIVKAETGGEWKAEYNQCRKFEVTSEIRPVR
jgi:hypothetical protein